MADVTKNVFKIVLVGDAYVGKTTLRKRYMGDNFETEYLMTIGADFSVKVIVLEDREVHIQIWDLAGQQKFSIIRDRYYKNADGAIIVFDLTRRDTFENIPNWIGEIINSSDGDMLPFVLVGNKSDLVDEVGADVSQDEITAYLEELGSWSQQQGLGEPIYIETSALTGVHVDKVFETIAQNLVSKLT